MTDEGEEQESTEAESSVPAEAASEEPSKKKIGPASPGTPAGKKKKKAAASSEATLTDPRALQLTTAFDAGDFVRVRELATALTKTDDADLSAMGRDYLARIAVDGVQIAFLGLCLMAILTIAWIYVPH